MNIYIICTLNGQLEKLYKKCFITCSHPVLALLWLLICSCRGHKLEKYNFYKIIKILSFLNDMIDLPQNDWSYWAFGELDVKYLSVINLGQVRHLIPLHLYTLNPETWTPFFLVYRIKHYRFTLLRFIKSTRDICWHLKSKPSTMAQSAQTTIHLNLHKALGLSSCETKWEVIYICKYTKKCHSQGTSFSERK